MPDNIFNIVAGNPIIQGSDFTKGELALGLAPSDTMIESLSQEEVISRVRDYLTKLDRRQPNLETNAKGDIKGELNQLERLIEDLEEKETIDQSTLRFASKEAENIYQGALKKIIKTAENVPHKRRKSASLRRMMAEMPMSPQFRNTATF